MRPGGVLGGDDREPVHVDVLAAEIHPLGGAGVEVFVDLHYARQGVTE